MKILQVIAEAPPIKSGVAKVAAELAGGFEARGHHVDTLSSSDIPRRSFGEFRFSAFIFHWFKWWPRLKDYDLINVHAPAPTFTDLFLMLASGFAGVMLSPLHLCFLLTNEYFDVSMGSVYKHLWWPCVSLIGASIIYFGILYWLSPWM